MKKYDLIVVGGGLSGVAASVAAAREGLSVLLVEKNQMLGGAPSNNMVNPFMKYYIEERKDDKFVRYVQLNTGIFTEIIERMEKIDNACGTGKYSTVFNEEYMKFVLENMCEESGVHVLFGTAVVEAKAENSVIKYIKAWNKSGYTHFCADYFIDCSGDGNLCAMAGAPFRLGREEDNLCQPMTLCFRIANVDTEQFKTEERQINPKYKEFQKAGKIKNIRENVLIFRNVAPGVLHFNTTRVTNLNPVDAEDVTKAQFIARKQMFEMFNFLRENFSCFKNSVLLMSAPEIGIRESRMIDGEYTYSKDDILNYTVFDDSIACGCYEIDIHNPSGTGTELIYLDRTRYYTIPYRCLIPKTLKNVLVAGRCISSTHEAQSAYRIMPIVCNIGQGAGSAIAAAKNAHTDVRGVDIKEIHKILDKRNMRYN